MASIGEQILARCEAVLKVQAATPANLNVFRSREIAITRKVVPAIVLVPKAEPAERFGSFADRNDLDVAAEIFVRGDPWDQLADAVYTPMHRLLTTDAQLLALCSQVRRISREFEAEEADLTAGTLTVTYRFTFLTSATDVSVGPKP